MTRKADLDRHVRSVHRLASSHFCPVRSCKRSSQGNKGFARKENLNTHCRRMHPFLKPLSGGEVSATQLHNRVDFIGISDSSDHEEDQERLLSPPRKRFYKQLEPKGRHHIGHPEVPKHRLNASWTTANKELEDITENMTLLEFQLRDMKEKIASLEMEVTKLRQSMISRSVAT
jgi:hypothetical protein